MSNDTAENVLILQGGGSLGALGCGVFKALASNNIKIDIVAGTSIGGLNATIIAGTILVGACGTQYEFKVACFNTYLPSKVDTVLLRFSISWK
jgi:hypothetical protein